VYTRVAAWIVLLFADVVFGQQLPFLNIPGASRNIRALLQDHLGRLWIGADTNVACFDGARFFSLHEVGLPVTGVSGISEDSEGAIWIAADTGVYRFFRGALQEVARGYASSVIATSPTVVLASVGPQGQGIPDHPFLIRIRRIREAWTTEKVISLPLEGWLTLDHTGMVLFADDRGWSEVRYTDILDWRPGTKIPVRKHELLTYNVRARVLRDRFGCLWHRSDSVTNYQCPGDSRPTQPPEIISGNGHMWEAPDGTMFLSSTGALAIGRPGAFHLATTANGLPGPDAVIAAKDGTVWLGGGKGLYRWPAPFALEYWTAREGREPGFAILRLGNKVFSGSGQGIAVLSEDRKRWSLLPQTRDLHPVYHLLPGPRGSLLAARPERGVAQVLPDGTITALSPPGSDGCFRLARTPDGQLWMVGRGVSRVRQEGSRFVSVQENLPGERLAGVEMEYESHTAKLWACYSGGLVSKEKDGWHNLTTKDGLLQDSCRSLAALPNGDVWVGYLTIPSFSLVRPSANGKVTVRHFSASREGEDAQVHFLDLDSRGWLWRASSDGVYVADPKDAENGSWVHLNDADGLPALDIGQQSFYNDPDGSVWWSSDDTLLHFSPKPDFVHPTEAPQIFISGFSWNAGTPKLADTVSAVPHGSNITAHIGSLQFDRRNALRVRYRWLPEQSSWKEGRSLDLGLGKLAWGTHTLEVQARLATGPWSPTASHSFTVLRPLWLSWPALLGLAAAGLATATGTLAWRKRRQARERRALPDVAEWRLPALIPEAQELAGTRLNGRFEPRSVLARGGFATVFEGHDLMENRRCAIKVFRRELSDTGLDKRFQQEVAALETIHHSNVVRIYGHGSTPTGSPYLVMEFIEGTTLREILNAGALSPGRIASLVRQAGVALDEIHSHRIYHRDLKPENIMIRAASTTEPALVLIDFSIAIVKDADQSMHGVSRAAGTFIYMAPEQVVGYAGAASDIYSLAKVILEMLTGRSLASLLPHATLDLSVRVRELIAGLPFALSSASIHLISSALEFDPARRPSNVIAFTHPIADDLERTIITS